MLYLTHYMKVNYFKWSPR